MEIDAKCSAVPMSATCSAPCALLQATLSSVTCAISTYDFSWGNDICEGILLSLIHI